MRPIAFFIPRGQGKTTDGQAERVSITGSPVIEGELVRLRSFGIGQTHALPASLVGIAVDVVGLQTMAALGHSLRSQAETPEQTEGPSALALPLAW